MKSLKNKLKNWIDMLKTDGKELADPCKPLTRLDYIMMLLVVIGAFWVTDTACVVQTAGLSFGYLNRQFLNFYEYGRECGMTEFEYMPLVYIIYAIWNLPLKLTLLVRYPMPEVSYYVLLWYRLLPAILYLACAYLVYKIAAEIGMGVKKSKLCALAAFTMPVGIFLQFFYGKLLVLPLFFMLLGILFYAKDNRWGFVGCFAAAIACHQYVLVLFLPLLLLREKRLRYLCENLIVAVLPFMLEYLLYRNSNTFILNVKLYSTEQNFTAGMNNGIFVIQYVVVLWILLLGWTYFTNAKNKKELISYALFFVGMTGTATLCLTDFAAEYFIFLVPVSVLSAFLHKDTKIFLILDICWAAVLAFYVFLRYFVPDSLDMAASLYTVLLLAIAVFKHPSFLAEKPEELTSAYAGWLRVSFLSGAVLCFVAALAVRLLG